MKSIVAAMAELEVFVPPGSSGVPMLAW